MLLRKIFNFFHIVFIVFLCSMLIANLYIITARLVFNDDPPKIFGFAQVIVISGSMQPTIDVGDMLIIQEKSSYSTNDIVTFHWSKSLVTHRVIEANDIEVVTKGDANNVADEPIPLSDIEGKVVVRIPGAGDIVLFLRTPFGILAMTLGVLLLIEIPFAVEWLKRLKK